MGTTGSAQERLLRSHLKHNVWLRALQGTDETLGFVEWATSWIRLNELTSGSESPSPFNAVTLPLLRRLCVRGVNYTHRHPTSAGVGRMQPTLIPAMLDDAMDTMNAIFTARGACM